MRSKYYLALLAAGISVAAIAPGCGGDDAADDDGAGGDAAAATSTTTGTPGPAGSGGKGGGGGGGTVDESTSCADAVELEEGMNTLGGKIYDKKDSVIDPAGDTDYFKFTVTADQWVALLTDANPDDDPMMVDTVITLYNADGSTQLAQVDDAFPRVTTDSELIHHFVAAGTYCLKVEEFSSWNGDRPKGSPDFTYRVVAIPIDFTLYNDYTLDTEPNDVLAMPQTLETETGDATDQIYTRIAGVLDPETDKEYFKVTSPTSSVRIDLDFTPAGGATSGQQGYGSTLGPGFVRLMNSSGTVLAQLDNQKGGDGLSVPGITALTDYIIEVNRPAGSKLGTNDFYFLKFFTGDTDNAREAEVGATGSNNTYATAEAGTGTPSEDGTTISFFVMGDIASTTDVDYWSFDAVAGDTVALACGALRSGSGLIGTTFAVHNATDTKLQEEIEKDTADIQWADAMNPNASMPLVDVTTTGKHFLSVRAAAADAMVLGKYYRCGIHVTTP